MELHVNQWGNSLGMRLPKALVKQFGLRKGSALDITFTDSEGFLVTPKKRSKRRRYTLKELLAKVPKDYDHRSDPEVQEWLNIQPVGKEIIDDDWS